MKKLFVILSVAGLLSFGAANVYAQDEAAPQAQTETVQEAPAPAVNPEVDVEGQPLHQAIKQKFIEGGVGWMTPVLLCLIFGLAVAIERIIYLNLSTTNTKKLLAQVEEALGNGGSLVYTSDAADEEGSGHFRGPRPINKNYL